TVLAANILNHADVSAFNDDFSSIVIAGQNWAKMGALHVARKFRCVVRRARQQNRCAFRPFGYEDDGVQLYAVTHWDHHLSPAVIKTIVGWLKFVRCFAW